MKNIIKFVFVILSVISLSYVIFAQEGLYTYEYSEEGITVVFNDTTILNENARQTIADNIVYDTPISQAYSLCWLLGHDITEETVSAIYHKRSEYEPRCQLEIYHVDICSNCDYTYPRLVSSQYISCCPPEASAVSIDDSHTH